MNPMTQKPTKPRPGVDRRNEAPRPDRQAPRALKRWRRRKAARPSEILDAALTVFAERGFSATRLDDVAARAGVSKGTLYLYFDGKEALLKAVVREALLPNLARIESRVGAYEGPSRKLLDEILKTIGGVFGRTRAGAIPKIIIAESGNFPELVRFYLDEVIRRAFALLARVLARGVASGEFRPIDVANTVRILAGSMLFLALWKNAIETHARETLDIDAFCRNLVEVLIHGIASPAG
jgi:AcrR family transcriptional regulator